MLSVTLEEIGACKIRSGERASAGVPATFMTNDAVFNEKIEGKLWSIHDENTEFVTRAMEAGVQLNQMFEHAVASGAISMEAMFDTDYVEIPGTNPLQHRSRILDWADRALPPFQEAFLAKDPRMVFCVAIDRNGYLPVHNKVYSHPQRAGDVTFNTANSRNRRIFNDTAGLAAGRNQRTYLIQSYARDMGNGNTVMMREIDVPIRVKGKHWGGFRTAYKL
jgi:methyl-accepting chemotaxis protein